MDIVVDANVVVATLVSPGGHTADVFFSPVLKVFAPEFLLEEIDEHKEELLQKTELSETDFSKLRAFLIGGIVFFPTMEFTSFFPKARELSPDSDDVAYLALALKLQYPLWSNDKALKSQKEVKVFSTSELLRFLP